MFRLCLCFALGFSSLVMAAGPTDREVLRNNEDLKFIKNWGKEQRLKSLAEALTLSPEQASQLRAMRAEVDRIKESFAGQKQALTQELEAAAKEIRQRLEGGGVLDQSDKDRMVDIRQRYARVRKEERLNIGLAILDIGDVLTDEQEQALREASLRHRGTRDRSKRGRSAIGNRAGKSAAGAHRGGGEARKGEGRGFKGREQGRREQRHRKEGSMARILLSDGFLKNLG